jgi:hypothetical protein
VEQIIKTLHSYNVYLVLLAAVVTGIWGLVLYFMHRDMIKPWRISMLVTVILGLLQGLFGVIMVWVYHLKPGTGTGLYYLHYMYGGIVALGIPLTWQVFTTNGKDRRKDLLIYSLAALLLFIVGIRAWMTGMH